MNFSDIRRENFDHFSYHHYAEDGTLQADIRNRYNASPEKSWGVRGMARYFWHWTDDIMFNPNYTLNYDYMSGDRMRYRLEVLDESKDQALGWLPSQAAHLLQALDRYNSYKSDYQRYRHMLTLDWQWNKQEGKGDTYSSWYLQLKPYFIVEQNNFDFRSFISPQRVKKTYNLAQNAFGVRAFYDKQTGVRTTQPVNINGNWNLGLSSGYSMPLDKQKRLMLTNTEYITYYHSVDFSTTQADVDPVRTAMKALWIEEELNLNYRFNKVNVGVLGAFSYGHIVTDRTDFTEVNTWKIRYGGNAVIDLPWSLQLSTELTMFSRRGFESEEMNNNDLVWNARLSKRLCKDRLTLMVDAWDILGNLSDMNNGVNSQTRWETYTNVIPSYVLFRVSYRFAMQPKKK